jgi:LPXTG-site transpeptidase (sortase) family protein
MAMQSITLNTGATVDGQALARNGAVTMDSNTITNNVCALSGFGIDVTKTSNPASGTVVVPGQAITYTLGYENSRATTITGAAIVDTLSPAVTYVPGTLAINGTPIPDTGNYNPATHVINVALPDIPADSLGNVTFQVTVGPWAVSRAGIANVGAFATSGTVVATTSPVVHFVDSVGIAKTIRNTSGSVIRTGSVLEWTIVVTNYGIVPATNVVVTDSVPANTTYVDGSITGKGADASLVPALRWNVGTIPVGGSVSLTFQSYVNPNTPNRTYISNRAYVVSDQGPQNVSPQVGGRVNDNPIVVVRTSGAEDITLGLMGLLGALALGFAWRGRPTSGSTRKRASRVTAAMLLSMLLVLGTMEVGASFGLPLPTPGDAITQATQSIMPAAATRTAGPAVSSSGVMGRVTIARIGISQKLVEGRTMSALAKGLWRQPTSVKPGDAGACVIAGHRTSRQFANLSKARAGDIVWVTYGRAKLKYRVASVTTLNVTPNTPGFRVGAKEKLVLYTCLPRWRGDKRTVVVCYRAR